LKEAKGEKRQKHIVLMGNNGSGKTALVQRLLVDKLDRSNQITTGVITEAEFEDHDGISIVDLTRNHDHLHKIADEIRDIDIGLALFVVSATDHDVVSGLEHWHKQLTKYAQNSDTVEKYLVVSKCDLNEAIIDEHRISKQFGIKRVHLVSSMDGAGIQALCKSIQSIFPRRVEEENLERVNIIVRTMIFKLCELIARHPRSLEDIEWRDLERVIAVSLEEIGFDVQLTPPSKDGGKDVIAKCRVSNQEKTYFIEIKHWRKGGKPNENHISEFVEVNVANQTDGGLFVSSSGFTNEVYSQLGELIRQKVRLGDDNKIVSMCRRYVRSKNGLWQNETTLPETLFEDTL
jgi:GTPase SAR1 family protein